MPPGSSTCISSCLKVGAVGAGNDSYVRVSVRIQINTRNRGWDSAWNIRVLQAVNFLTFPPTVSEPSIER